MRTMLRDSRPAVLTALLLGLLAVSPARAQVVEYYHTDAIGNVRAITDASGNVIERHDYQPYGEEWLPQGGTQPLRFTGKERDAETELDYFGARYYGSKIGRFTTVDPVYTWRENLLDPQRWNRYAYARNNPLRYVDPDGRETVLLQGGRTSDNVFGHVAIGINGQVFSFGTNYSNRAQGVQDWGTSQEGYLAAQSDRRATDILTLNVTDAQERTLLQQLQQNNPHAAGTPGHNLLTNSCVTVSEQALEKSGVLPNQPGPVTIDRGGNALQAGAPKSFTPGGLAQQVRDGGRVKSTQRVGQERASSIQSVAGTVAGAVERAQRAVQ